MTSACMQLFHNGKTLIQSKVTLISKATSCTAAPGQVLTELYSYIVK